MNLEKEQEILVWTSEGYEGRFLRWEEDAGRAFEHRNYRHWFSSPQPLTAADLAALRKAYNLSLQAISDRDLSVTSPDDPPKLGNTSI